ncbi:hypothetical protein [Streptomyces murinus]|uniref:hypothetical protein n=1 Tax=Streptomyces murinus TaxID=33900 RepID=UPI0018F6E478|nr:hypothetical protein [Streptomyces murinus]
MPNKPKTQHRSVRISDDDWADLLAAAKAQDTDRAGVINELVAWYLRRPGVTQPKRPELSAWERPASSEEKTA